MRNGIGGIFSGSKFSGASICWPNYWILIAFGEAHCSNSLERMCLAFLFVELAKLRKSERMSEGSDLLFSDSWLRNKWGPWATPILFKIASLEMPGDSPPGFPDALLIRDDPDEESDDVSLGESRLRVERGIAS